MPNDSSAPLPYLEVAAYLEAQGLTGGATGWAMMRGTMPATPDQVLAVFPAGGLAPEGGSALRHPAIQLRVRGAVGEQTPAYLKLEDALDALRQVRSTILGGGYYAHILPESDVMPMGRDEGGRYEFAITLRAAREPAA